MKIYKFAMIIQLILSIMLVGYIMFYLISTVSSTINDKSMELYNVIISVILIYIFLLALIGGVVFLFEYGLKIYLSKNTFKYIRFLMIYSCICFPISLINIFFGWAFHDLSAWYSPRSMFFSNTYLVCAIVCSSLALLLIIVSGIAEKNKYKKKATDQ